MKARVAIPVPNSDAEYSKRTLPEYKHAVEMAGAEAVEIPLNLTNAEAAQLIKTCDAVLLPGSPADVDPQKYGATRRVETANADAARMSCCFKMRSICASHCWESATDCRR
jgi:putative glutamine amidotransferase